MDACRKKFVEEEWKGHFKQRPSRRPVLSVELLARAGAAEGAAPRPGTGRAAPWPARHLPVGHRLGTFAELEVDRSLRATRFRHLDLFHRALGLSAGTCPAQHPACG